jgi:hypothetical protein
VEEICPRERRTDAATPRTRIAGTFLTSARAQFRTAKTIWSDQVSNKGTRLAETTAMLSAEGMSAATASNISGIGSARASASGGRMSSATSPIAIR